MRPATTLTFSLLLAAALASPTSASAHCDTLDGPVVSDARKALETGNLNAVLVWVREQDEAEIRAAFGKARNVRRAGGDARQLADLYFFETLVRVHRMGEGAPYTGLKPSGAIEPAVAQGDRAIASGTLKPLQELISERSEQGLRRHFDALMSKKKRDPNDVSAGRAYAKSYVEFIHYAERLYDAAETLAPEAVAGPGAAPEHRH